jgi:transitional endoplasmic reticulum ATPase
LHGPPGAGKTFIAQAIAGEFGINFIPVSPSELTSSYLGGSARLIANLFNFAHEYTPCIVFFDEFDSLAVEREGGIDPERRLIVNQLLRSLEEVRKEQELIVIAATNELELLDPAIIRPGRFDYHIHIGYPDQEARRAILSTQLAEIPVAADLDLNDIARRLDGSSAADVASIVRKTALNVFREKVQLDHESTAVITQKDLLKTLSNRSGRDRPKVGPTSWDELILPMETKEELMEIEKIIENQDLADKLGIDPPNGVLLYGPPGTGKTTIAKVLASETRASFYLISAADILTKWFGESERKIKKLFERARRNRPSIIFIDEIDALAPRRTGLSGVQDTIVNQLLNEIDGMSTQPGVFVIGATNRPDTLDPALLRGGRLSRQIQIPLPDPKCRAQLLHLMTADMPLAKNINLAAYIELTDGFSGADIETFCQEAAQEAFNRLHLSGEPQSPIIETQDFDKALIEHKQHRYNQGDK